MNDIKGFTFYKSYYESLKNLKEKDKKDITNAILEYIFDDKIPNFSGTKKAVWALIEPNLNTSKNRSNPYSGAPYGNQNASKEKQSKNNQKTTSHLKDKEIDKDKDKDKEREIDILSITPPTTPTEIFNFCLSAFPEYVEEDLEKKCKKFFKHYEAKKWKGIYDWKSKVEEWVQQDIEKNEIREKRKKDIDPDRVLEDEDGRLYQENYDGSRYYF